LLLDLGFPEKQNKGMSIQFEKAKSLLISHRRHLSRLGTRHLAIFGSTVRNEATKSSDIDILVDFDAKKGFFVFADLKFYLEEIMNCHVDLVSTRALHPALKKRILSEAKQIF
jgi:uncharacterized protein